MNFIDKMVERFIKLNRRMKRWQRVVSVMAAVVVFATTYALILPAITLDTDTATTQSGIEVAASENEPDEAGTVFESVEEELIEEKEPVTEVEENLEEAAAEENSGSESGSQGAEETQSEVVDDNDADEGEQTEVLSAEEAATYSTTEAAIAAVTGKTAEEIKLITEDTKLVFNDPDDEYVVTAEFGESAKLPEGVQLRVKEITKESDPEAYEAYYQKALSEMQDKYDENTKLSFAKFYDIAFIYEGTEIEPSGNVNVKIEYKQAVEIEKATTVDTIHFDKNDEEKAEVISSDTKGSEKEVEAVEFESDRFSVYGIVGTETITTEFLSHNGTKYEVTVTYGPEAKIPEGSTLSVTDIEEGTEAYDYARNAVLADKKEKGEFVDITDFNLAALDISIIDPNGQEIEPEATVQVDIKIKDLPGVENLDEIKDSLEIQHHVEVTDGVVVEKVFDGSEEGTFRMDTNETVAEKGTAVDPNSVSDEDFIIEVNPTDESEVNFDEIGGINASFDTPVFSTFTITWGGGANDSTTSLRIRFRTNGTNRDRYVTVHYVDSNGTPITRPTGINGNTYVTTTDSTTEAVVANTLLGNGITGREFIAAHYGSYDGDIITRMVGSRSGGTNYLTFYNNNTQVANVSDNNANIYLVYSGPTAGNSTTVHYGYMDGTTFKEFDAQPSPTTVTTSNHAYLIYDFDGYQYADETYYRSTEAASGANMKTGATEIQARLIPYQGSWYGYTGSSYVTVENGSHIYVVYEQKPSASTGGAPTAPTDAPDAAKPTILKESTPNTDGTSTLGLSITGYANDVDPDKLADVIVVLDVSGSMYNNSDMGNNTRRITAARNAVNSLAKTLLDQNTTEKPELFRMALVTFSTSGTTTQGFTTDLGTYQSAVNNVSTGGGTNWEEALEIADQMAVSSDRATFVIFVTDGDPTFRVSRMDATDAQLDMYGKNGNDDYYVSDNVFGEGNDDSQDRNYNAALKVAQSIKSHNKSFYTIGISSDVTNLNNFADAAGADGKYTATTSSALTEAFEEIAENIKAKVGWGDIKMTDGITQLTSTMEKNNLVEVDGSSFTYWKKAKDANDFVEWDPASENAQEATYNSSTGAVEWDMGHNFMPEDGATYKVEFLVWPSQQAYDIIAKLNNGTITYDSLTDAQRAQIIKNGNTYTLVTNCNDPDTTYKRATKSGSSVSTTGDTKQLFFNTVRNLGLDVDKLTIKKEWVNDLDPDDRWKTEVIMDVKGDGELFKTVTLNSSNNWTNSDSFISCGLIKTNSDGTYQVLEKGHDFVIEEPAEYGYYWNFDTNIYRPMIIGTTLTMLVKDEAGTYEIDGNKYRTLNQDEAAATLTATNIRRSNLNLTKVLKDQDGNDITSDSTDLFEFKITVNNINADKGSADNLDSDYYVWFSVYDPAAGATVHGLETNATPEAGDTGFYYAASGTEISVKLQPGWNLRFTNLPTGTTYTIQEVLEDGFEFDSAGLASGQTTFNITDGTTGSGRIDNPNTQYTVTYTNISKVVDIVVKKTDDEGTASLDGAKFVLQKKNATETYVNVGEEFTVPASGFEIKSLIPGDYKLVEITPPDGYIVIEKETYFKVNEAGSAHIIELANGTTNALVSGTNDNTVSIKNTPGAALPNTGGSGTLPYTLGGIAFIMASALMYGFRMRRRERRSN